MSFLTLLLCPVLLLPGAWAAPREPSAVRGVLSAVPFVLEAPYRFDWSAQHPQVRSGTLLVLAVDPASLTVRDIGQPVLYVGSTPAEILGRDTTHGTLTVLVPGALQGDIAVYFGSSTLPETVTVEAGARELAEARASGLELFRLPRTLAAVRLADHAAVLEWAASPAR